MTYQPSHFCITLSSLCCVNQGSWALCVISTRHLSALLWLVYLELENSEQLRYSLTGPKAEVHSLFTCWGPQWVTEGLISALTLGKGKRELKRGWWLRSFFPFCPNTRRNGQFTCSSARCVDGEHISHAVLQVKIRSKHKNIRRTNGIRKLDQTDFFFFLGPKQSLVSWPCFLSHLDLCFQFRFSALFSASCQVSCTL